MAQNARKPKQAQNHSLATMSATEIVTILIQKMSAQNGEKEALTRNVLGKNRFMTALSPIPPQKGLEGLVRVIVPQIMTTTIIIIIIIIKGII